MEIYIINAALMARKLVDNSSGDCIPYIYKSVAVFKELFGVITLWLTCLQNLLLFVYYLVSMHT